jgi:hypothetical protein
MKNTYFSKTKKSNQSGLVLNRMIDLLNDVTTGGQVIPGKLGGSALALESLSDNQVIELNNVSSSLSISIESIIEDLGLKNLMSEAQVEAGVLSGIYASDFKRFLSHKMDFPNIATESMSVIPFAGGNDVCGSERSFALESYDERENRNAVIYSIAYNIQSARQDQFGETFFPTIVVTPDNVGFGITVNILNVYDGVERNISGAFTDFKKKNIIRAIADPTVLRKDQTKVVPVARAQSLSNFIDPTVVATRTIMLEGEAIVTAPLAFGKKIDLLGISQTDTLLNAGIMDQTDSLDPTIGLQNVYVKVGDDVLKIPTSNLPWANFNYNPQNNYRTMVLNFSTSSVLVNKNSKRADGSALTTLAAIVTGDLIVRLEMNVSGQVNIETGETNIFGNSISVHSVQDNVGNFLDMTAAPALALVTAFAAAEFNKGGYDVLAYRTNMNRRQRGQLIDVTKFTQLYNVPLRSPITAIHPINTDGQTDASDVQALITTTRIRTSNAAVGALLETTAQLRDYVDARDVTGNGPDILGVGRFYVRPTFYGETIDLNAIINSLTSHERAADIQAALVNKIRDYSYRLYRDSEYQAAADALAGGTAPVPVVIIGTDPVIARYLTVTGDLRTLGGEFDVRIVSTLDNRVKDKIFITFGVFDESRNSAPNPMNFGNMVWSPELVLAANISRGGTISKETVVQPKYLFVTHLPVLSVLTVTNIPDTINKQAIDVNNLN